MIKMIKMIKMSGFPNSGWGGWLGDHGASEGRSARRFGHEALDPDRTEASKRRDVSVFSRGRTPAIGGEPPLERFAGPLIEVSSRRRVFLPDAKRPTRPYVSVSAEPDPDGV